MGRLITTDNRTLFHHLKRIRKRMELKEPGDGIIDWKSSVCGSRRSMPIRLYSDLIINFLKHGTVGSFVVVVVVVVVVVCSGVR